LLPEKWEVACFRGTITGVIARGISIILSRAIIGLGRAIIGLSRAITRAARARVDDPCALYLSAAVGGPPPDRDAFCARDDLGLDRGVLKTSVSEGAANGRIVHIDEPGQVLLRAVEATEGTLGRLP
jgi:hypothetical protein